MRHETTHPWINFSINMQDADPRLWLMLGECKSKIEHIANVPLWPATAKELYKLYLAKGVLATTAIEGNTLSEQEVRDHLDGKLKVPPSREYLKTEIENIIEICTRIDKGVIDGVVPLLSYDYVCDINRDILQELELDEGVIPGEIRKHSVVVGAYRGAPYEECEYLLRKLMEWLNSDDFECDNNDRIVYSILKAIISHVYIAWIHPFGDGNGRTARIIEHTILTAAGVPAVSTHLLSNHYNMTRSDYYRKLDHASKTRNGLMNFIRYAVLGLLDELKSQIDLIWNQQWEMAWRNYVHSHFSDKNSFADVRRRRLALDISSTEKGCKQSEIPAISGRMAEYYLNIDGRTLTRDLRVLVESGLINLDAGVYRAKKETILAFRAPSMT